MEINYIRIYRDECDSDYIFEQYCKLEHSILDDDGESVVFYTVSINDVPSKRITHE